MPNLTRDEVERRLAFLTEALATKERFQWEVDGEQEALRTAQSLYDAETIANTTIANLHDEIDKLRETNTRLNRRCTKAEAFADKSIEQLRDAGQRTFGRMLANYAAESALRKVEEVESERDQLAAEGRVLREWGERWHGYLAVHGWDGSDWPEAPLITAEVSRVRLLEAVAEAGLTYFGKGCHKAERDALWAALAAWREGEGTGNA